MSTRASRSKTRQRPRSQPAAKVQKLKEITKVRIGPSRLTRFERARILGARALQLALGAPSFVPADQVTRDPLTLAVKEFESKALPISIRRTLPNGDYQDIPVEWLL